MGSLSSVVAVAEGEALATKDKLKPTDRRWITAHAIATELSLGEVDRLWLRFRQLGSNKDGAIPLSLLEGIPDVFGKNILKNLCSPKTKKLSFENFLRCIKWLEEADVDSKLKGLFVIMSGNGKVVKKGAFLKALMKIHGTPQKDQQLEKKSNDNAERLWGELDVDKQGELTEEGFVSGVRRVLSERALKEVLTFTVLPDYLRVKMYHDLSEFVDAASPSSKTG